MLPTSTGYPSPYDPLRNAGCGRSPATPYPSPYNPLSGVASINRLVTCRENLIAPAFGLVHEVLLVRGEQALAVSTLHQLDPAAVLWLLAAVWKVAFPVPIQAKLCAERKCGTIHINVTRITFSSSTHITIITLIFTKQLVHSFALR